MTKVSVQDFAVKVWAYMVALKAAGAEDEDTETLLDWADALSSQSRKTWSFKVQN